LFGAQELCVILLSQLSAELYDVAALEVLNQACESGVPAIRYQAATALMPLLLKREFRGALRAEEVIVEMLRLDGNALVLVIGTNPSLSMHASAVLNQMGLRVMTATAGQDALRAVEDGYPVEYILFVDRTGDIALTQLVQRLRSHFRSSTIPMAVLLPEYRSGEVPLLNEVSGLVASFVPPDDAGMVNILRQCNELPKQRQRLTNADRIAWKTNAKDFLNRVASMPSNEIPSSLRTWSEFARENLDQAIVNAIDNNVLAEMGNLEGQRELTRRLIAAGNDAELRLAIGELLKRTIRFHGVKMSRADVESLYDAYNKQGPTDPAAARAIGEVIDQVELYAKENGWESIVSDGPSIATK
jgi:CheY-like chemotaxis protein